MNPMTKPRTIATALTTNAFDVYLNLDKRGIIDLVYFITEDTQLKHPKHLCNIPYLSMDYPPETIELFRKYTEGIHYDDELYEKFHSHMYRLSCNIGRHDKDFQYIPSHDYVHSINMIYRFYYGLLLKEKIELVIFGYTPHVGHDNILYWICELIGIKTIITHPCCTIGSNKPFMQYAFNLSDSISFHNIDTHFRNVNETINDTFNFIHPCTKFFKPYKKNFPLQNYLNPLRGIRNAWNFICSRDSNGRNLWDKAIHSLAIQSRAYFLYRDYKKSQAKHFGTYDDSKKFVYFALHYQPELTTSMRGIYEDQLLALERLSAIIPKDWIIYAKENPTQREYMRGDLFFKRMSLIPNVCYLDALIPSSNLLKKCQFVASINGSVTFESISGGKPALIFGEAWWDILPGVIKYHSNITIDEILSTKIDKKILLQSLNNYLSKTPNATTDYEDILRQFNPEFSHEENIKTLENFIEGLVRRVIAKAADNLPL